MIRFSKRRLVYQPELISTVLLIFIFLAFLLFYANFINFINQDY